MSSEATQAEYLLVFRGTQWHHSVSPELASAFVRSVVSKTLAAKEESTAITAQQQPKRLLSPTGPNRSAALAIPTHW
jgi:hypothetical protein